MRLTKLEKGLIVTNVGLVLVLASLITLLRVDQDKLNILLDKLPTVFSTNETDIPGVGLPDPDVPEVSPEDVVTGFNLSRVYVGWIFIGISSLVALVALGIKFIKPKK